MDLGFFKGKRVFVTGHTGFKGTWLCKILINAGAEVIGYALCPNEDQLLFKASKIDEHMKSIIGDIQDLNSLKRAVLESRPELIFHMAAQPLVRESYKNPVETYEINVMGTVNILECLRNTPSAKSFVNITTDKVYENKETDVLYKESDNLCGFDPYSNSKSCSELVTYSYKNSFLIDYENMAISTARSGNVIGGGDFSKHRIIPDCIRAANQNKNIEVRNPNSIRPYQHVLECLSGYLTLAKLQFQNKEIQGCYNFGPTENDIITTGELAEIFCKYWGNDIKCEYNNYEGPHEAGILKLSIEKSRDILGWKPKWDIDYAVEKTVEWTKSYIIGEQASKCMDIQIGEYFNLR